jgi:hypothetical protein
LQKLRDAAPIFVFIRGGAWRSGRSKDFAAPAKMFLVAGAHYVVPDFAWVQDVNGSLVVLADQVCRAIAWVYENARISAATQTSFMWAANLRAGTAETRHCDRLLLFGGNGLVRSRRNINREDV